MDQYSYEISIVPIDLSNSPYAKHYPYDKVVWFKTNSAELREIALERSFAWVENEGVEGIGLLMVSDTRSFRQNVEALREDLITIVKRRRRSQLFYPEDVYHKLKDIDIPKEQISEIYRSLVSLSLGVERQVSGSHYPEYIHIEDLCSAFGALVNKAHGEPCIYDETS